MKANTNTQPQTVTSKAVYTKPVLKNAGSLAELTQGFSGSIPDEQGGHTKRNPFQG
ncbi:lasso RiPP family leader peptide-containing protein [Colwellia sp. MSW7]|uniref:Lasso RiPP family leader peptide-containing protein n=1 Tax=Colwellia maritima TaxID=2912588 RepID=A0ABS9X6R2_9GAMM|nr:lasso RiPP family leader peptide-containing protein [Colwellia maritima]MCI2285462.1 lasso RiPP family leader peptide-containing protein [Colwellia maritima]